MKAIIIGFVLVVVLGIGAWFILGPKSSPSTPKESNSETSQATQTPQIGSYGSVISGSSSPFVEFTQVGYKKALADGKIIFLNFYANWCPVCRAEAPIIDSGFDSLNNDKIVGFRVNFKDSETDEDEKKLASEFNIPYQHTKIFLVNGQEADRYPNQWEMEDFDAAFSKYTR